MFVFQVVGDLMLRIQRIPDFTPKLLLVRKRLLGLEPEGVTYVLSLRTPLILPAEALSHVLKAALFVPLPLL